VSELGDVGAATEDVTLGWAGHSTVSIDAGGHRLVTDPLLTARVGHLRRRCPLPDDSLGDADVLLVSHAHLDHLHGASLRRVRAGVRVVAPAGTARILRRAGLRDITEVRSGDTVELPPFRVIVVPADHPVGRWPCSLSTTVAVPVGYVVEVAGRRVYFPGDTDLFAQMATLGPIDVATLPIWGWGPTIGPGHLDPARAIEAMATTAAGLVIPIHWGTYAPENGRRRPPAWLPRPAAAFESLVSSAGHRDRLARLSPGESITLATSAQAVSRR
jgi:L-ascorbate metabolism protein UlaG (beta-lactamase superfamily)